MTCLADSENQNNAARVLLCLFLSLLLYAFNPAVTVGAEAVKSDDVKSTVASASIKDGCQGFIPSGGKAKYDCGIQSTPPTVSEFCAYENVGDTLDILYRTYGILIQQVEEKQKTIPYFVVRDKKTDQVVYQQRVPGTYVHWGNPGYIDAQKEVKWNLTNNSGRALNVGEKGKFYKVSVFLKKSATLSTDDINVFYRSKTLDVFVDDCNKRQAMIRKLASDSATNHPGFRIYLKLEDQVAIRICEHVRKGLVEYSNSGFDLLNGTFSQRCRVQCINNYFAGKLLNNAKSPADKNADPLINSFAQAHYYSDTWQLDNLSWNHVRYSLLNYIYAEDYIRAQAYKNCGGPLNILDTESAKNIIREGIDSTLFPYASMGSDLAFGITHHLDNTMDIYNSLPK